MALQSSDALGDKTGIWMVTSRCTAWLSLQFYNWQRILFVTRKQKHSLQEYNRNWETEVVEKTKDTKETEEIDETEKTVKQTKGTEETEDAQEIKKKQ